MKQDYAKAREWYEKAAASGDADAQKSLGDIYAQGLGVKQDYGKARYWVEKTAVAGNADAQNNLAFLYERGLGGLKADSAKAKYWLEKAAAQGDKTAKKAIKNYQDHSKDKKEAAAGNREAQKNLGDIYVQVGVKRDYGKALESYTKAAEAGNAEAQNELGMIYMNGYYNVQKDKAKARYWLEKAAAQGHDMARMPLPYLRD